MLFVPTSSAPLAVSCPYPWRDLSTMLATMNPSHHDLPLREHSNANVPHDSREAVGESMGLDDRLCPGCKKSAVSEQGGLVVAFGYVLS